SGGVLAVAPDVPVTLSGRFGNDQDWAAAVHADDLWSLKKPAGRTPAIAVVDSGVDGAGPDLGGRVTNVDLTSSGPNARGDGYGHGTFVAALAAGAGKDFAGAAPTAPVVSLDVVDDSGHA